MPPLPPSFSAEAQRAMQPSVALAHDTVAITKFKEKELHKEVADKKAEKEVVPRKKKNKKRARSPSPSSNSSSSSSSRSSSSSSSSSPIKKKKRARRRIKCKKSKELTGTPLGAVRRAAMLAALDKEKQRAYDELAYY
eukprot:2410997-Pleurochrysis_carterae.AAC.1